MEEKQQVATPTDDPKDDLENRYLTFVIEDAVYGLPLSHVLEIINIQSITQVPNIEPHVKGIINLRGKVVPILDARLKMEKEEREYDDKTCIIVIVIHDMQVGLIVDSVSEVITSDQTKMAAPPRTMSIDSQFLSSVVEQDDKVILNIDVEKFLQSDLYGL